MGKVVIIGGGSSEQRAVSRVSSVINLITAGQSTIKQSPKLFVADSFSNLCPPIFRRDNLASLVHLTIEPEASKEVESRRVKAKVTTSVIVLTGQV